MALRKTGILRLLLAVAIVVAMFALQQTAYAAGVLSVGDATEIQTNSRLDDLNGAVVAAQDRVGAANADLASALDEQAEAQAAIDAETDDPKTNEGHKDWTAYGLFKSIRDNAEPESAAYWDAQCAMDILDGGANTTGHSYPSKQGPVPDGRNASNWANIADGIAWAERGDAVALDNVRASLEFLNEFNSIRGEENAAEGTSLSTAIGTNCRQMAISIVQCDASKDFSVGHTQAYEGLENLSWSSAKGVPFSRSKYTDPYVGWYDEEKVNYKENNGGVTGHYTTIVDLNSGYYCEIAGFAVCSYNASYGECRELSTFGDFFQYDTNPTPEVQYSVAELQQITDDYYADQVEAGMFGTTDEVRVAHAAALESATTRVANAQAELTAAQQALADAENERDAFTNLAANDAISVSGVGNVQYDGSEHKPMPVISVASSGAETITLLEGVDYTVSYPSSDYANAGEAVVQITGTGQKGSGTWWGTREIVFNITPKRLDAVGIEVALSETSFTYNGQVQKPSIEYIGGEALAAGIDYDIMWSNAESVNAGTYTVTATGKGNYAGTTQPAEYTIAKAASSILLTEQHKEYAGEPLEYSGEIVRTGSSGKIEFAYFIDEACSESVRPSDVKSAGTYYVVAKLAADDNHEGAISAPTEFVIEPMEITVPSSVELTYSASEQFGIAPGDGYEQSGEASAINVGDYTVTLIAKDNYTFPKGANSVDVQWKIVPAKVTIAATNKSKTYGATDPKLTANVTGAFEGDPVIYTLVREAGENVGEYAIAVMPEASSNYDVTCVSGVFSIVKASQSILVSDVKKTYGNAAFALGAKLTKGDGKLTFSSSNAKVAVIDAFGKVTIKGAGTAKITVKAAATSNYKAASKTAAVTVAKASGAITIKPAKKTLSIKAGKSLAASKVFKVVSNVSKGAVTYKKIEGNKKIAVAKNGKVTVKKGLKKGKAYKVTVRAASSATDNYNAATSKVITLKIRVK